MKKIISAALVLALFCLLLCACDISDITGGSLKVKYKQEGDGLVVTSVPDNLTVPEIVIPDEYDGKPVTGIADFAAVNLENVTKITIGSNVREIGLWALENNKRVTAIEVDDDNEYFCDVDGVLYTKDMKTLLFYPLARGVTDMAAADSSTVKGIVYEIPEGVETIRTKAFYRCTELRGITLPSTLKRIEEKAFFRCSFEEITLPDTLEYIGKDAFGYCTNLGKLEIPAGIKEIGEYAFYNCTSLLDISIAASEDAVILGKSWQPTNNGLKIDGLQIIWQK